MRANSSIRAIFMGSLATSALYASQRGCAMLKLVRISCNVALDYTPTKESLLRIYKDTSIIKDLDFSLIGGAMES